MNPSVLLTAAAVVWMIASASPAAATSPPVMTADVFARQITDVTGHAGPVCPEQGICIITFADKDGAERLTAWMSTAGTTVATTWPSVPLRYANIADVSSVPGMFEGLVTRLLARMDRSNQQDLQRQYAELGIDLTRQGTRYSLIPDFDGTLRQALAVTDSGKYWIWIVRDRRLIALRSEGDARNDAAWYLQQLHDLLSEEQSTAATSATARREVP